MGRRLGVLAVALLVALLPSIALAQVAPSPDEVTRGDPSKLLIALVFNVGAGFGPGTAILDAFAGYTLITETDLLTAD